jgi:hypothetical protein
VTKTAEASQLSVEKAHFGDQNRKSLTTVCRENSFGDQKPQSVKTVYRESLQTSSIVNVDSHPTSDTIVVTYTITCNVLK